MPRHQDETRRDERPALADAARGPRRRRRARRDARVGKIDYAPSENEAAELPTPPSVSDAALARSVISSVGVAAIVGVAARTHMSGAEGSHTILLLQPTSQATSRTYQDFETLELALDGVCARCTRRS